MPGAIFRNVNVEYKQDGTPSGNVKVDGLLFTVPTAFLSSLGSINATSGGNAFVTRNILWPYGGDQSTPTKAATFSLNPGYNVPTVSAPAASVQADIAFSATPAYWDGAYTSTAPALGSAGTSGTGFWIGTQ